MKDDEILPFERKELTIRSDIEEIVLHLNGKAGYEKISPALDEKLKRMQQCRDYLLKYGSRIKVLPLLKNDFNISRAQAYALMNDAIDVFNTLTDTRGRDMLIDIVMEKVFETWRKAHAKGDFKTAAVCEGRMIEIIEKFFGGQEAKLYERIQPPANLFGFFPELLNVPVPDNLEIQISRILKRKESRDLQFDEIEEAKIITDDDSEYEGD